MVKYTKAKALILNLTVLFSVGYSFALNSTTEYNQSSCVWRLNSRSGNKVDSKRLINSALILCFVTTMMIPIEFAQAGDIAHGSKVFKDSCSPCHVGGKNLVVTEKSLSEEAIIRHLGSVDEATIKTFVQDGMVHRGVFAFGHLTEAEYTDVSSYITDQALENKW